MRCTALLICSPLLIVSCGGGSDTASARAATETSPECAGSARVTDLESVTSPADASVATAEQSVALWTRNTKSTPKSSRRLNDSDSDGEAEFRLDARTADTAWSLVKVQRDGANWTVSQVVDCLAP